MSPNKTTPTDDLLRVLFRIPRRHYRRAWLFMLDLADPQPRTWKRVTHWGQPIILGS